ncbi:MAG: HEAT repeat domain-containing protein [Bryobacteraceae bacterium]|nr:HEAT repeat domain-containing protein [Bryobacteraceae bacterium]
MARAIIAIAYSILKVLVSPDRYSELPVYDLLAAAARGRIGVDRRLLRAILSRFEQAVPDLVRFGLEPVDNHVADMDLVLLDLFSYRPTPEALPFLIACARRNHRDFPEELFEAFSRLGAASVEPLLRLYEEVGAAEGEEIAFALASLGVRDERIRRLLEQRLALDPADASLALATYGDPAARPALEAALSRLNGNAPETAWARREIEAALAELDEPKTERPAEPFDLWSRYPETALPEVDLLSEAERLQLLHSPEESVRRAAALSFRYLKPSATVEARLRETAAADPSAAVRAACWEALAESEDPEIRQALMDRLRDESAPTVERGAALVALARHMDDPAVRRYAIEFCDRPEVRARALEAMRYSLDYRLAEYFPRYLDDPDLETRRQAILGIGWLGLKAHVGKLLQFFKDHDLRLSALEAYALAAPAEISRLSMRRLLGKIERLAGGLSPEEAEMVQAALDDRLRAAGLKPLWTVEHRPEDEDEQDEDDWL